MRKIVIYNGGIMCDAFRGPCACGAWHDINTDAVNDQIEIIRAYLWLIKKERMNDESKSRV